MLIDIVFVIFVLIAFISGLRKGLIHSIFGFFGLFFGLLLALKYSFLLSDYLFREDIITSKYLPLISFFLVFFVVLVAVNLLAALVERVAGLLFLGVVNRLIGGLLWAVVNVLIFSTLLWYMDQMQFISDGAKAASRFYPYMITIAPLVIDQVANLLPYFKGMFEALESLFFEIAPPAKEIKGVQV